MALGTVYAFSVFRNPLMQKFGWTITQTSLAFTIALVAFTVCVLIGGRWQDKVGPRIVATVGGVLVGVGQLMAGFTNSLFLFYLSYGVIAGAGIGFGYVTPVSTVIKWFPEKRGLMTGLAVFGFGLGSLVFAPLAARLIVLYGVLNTFKILGLVFLVGVVGCAQALRNPPPGWKPFGWNPVSSAQGRPEDRKEYSPLEMVSTPQFWLIWVTYLIGVSGGLMVISQASPMGQEITRLSPAAAASAVGILALFNGFGRVFWGAVGDRLGRTRALMLLFTLYALDMFVLLPRATSYGLFVAGVSAAAFSFGGFLATMPALTADFFGTKNLGVNYGWVYTAYGAGAVFGPMLIAYIRQLTGGYRDALYILAALTLLGGVLTSVIRKPDTVRASVAPSPTGPS